MRLVPASVAERARDQSGDAAQTSGDAARRHRVRPLDDGTTEHVQVIEFVLRAGDSIQPVLWLERRLLD